MTAVTGTTAPCVLFLHAHPDDEAIFTGGTIARLVETGHRVVVVLATNGATHPRTPLAAIRTAEARVGCARLGVHRLEFLGYGDSGLHDHVAEPHSFSRADPQAAATWLAELVRDEQPAAMVVYDPFGIYGHPDHIAVHRVGTLAASMAQVPTLYETTVDREYLHFVETHLVGHAVESLLGAEISAVNAAPMGVPTVLVTTTVDVRDQCAVKRSAMAAHASQIATGSEAMAMSDETFQGVYGFEWYMRTSGPRGPLDDIAF